MHKLYELKEKLMRELEDYSENGKFSKEDVEAIKYITSAIDHICNIVEDEEYSNAGGGSYNSYNNGGMGGGSYRRGGGSSYARGGRGGGRSNRGGSYDYSYSRAREDLAEQLRELMQDAPDERVRSEIERLAAKVEKM